MILQWVISCKNGNSTKEVSDQNQSGIGYPDDWSPFIDACYNGKLEVVKDLLGKGENVNQKSCNSPQRKYSSDFHFTTDPVCDDWYPITFAIEGGNHQIIKLLFESGAKPDVIDKHGYSLLMYAVMQNDSWTIKHLLKLGQDINHQSKDGETAIMLSDTVRNNDVYYLLKKNGAKIDLYSAIKHDDFELVKKLLIGNLSAVSIPDQDGWPPLILASIYSSKDLVKFLIDNNADINQKNIYGGTAIMHAALRNRIEIVRILLNAGANVHDADSNLQYVIIWAVRSENIRIVKLIIEKGANVNVIDSDGKTPLDWAESNPEIQEYLIKCGARSPSFF